MDKMESDLTLLVQLYDGISEDPTWKLTLGCVHSITASTPTSKVSANPLQWAIFLLVKHSDGEIRHNKIVHR